MTIQEMLERKRELGYSNDYLSEITGVPVPTIQKIFSGKTKAPRMATIRALEEALSIRRSGVFSSGAPFGADTSQPKQPAGIYDVKPISPGRVGETAGAYAFSKKGYTVEDIYALPDGIRAELIDGEIYYMGSLSRIHQEIIGEMYVKIAEHIRSHEGRCKVYLSPFAVFLFGDDLTYVEPDLCVVCNPDKLDDRGCVGAPDWVVEVLSPSSGRMDCIIKLIKYRAAGVREYWIVDPKRRTIAVYVFDGGEEGEQVKFYSFEEEVPCCIFPGLQIRLAEHV